MLDKKDPINFITGDYKLKYEIINTIQEENFKSIYLVKSKISEEIRVLNTIPKSRFKNINNLKKDLHKLSEIDNLNIIKIIDVFISFTSINIITEYIQGVTLKNKLTSLLDENKAFSEEKAACIFRQIILALKYTHSNNIIHGEIKLENIIIANEDEEKCVIKIANFSMSNNYTKEFLDLKNKIGINYYHSPESLDGENDEYSDIWSAGVLLYLILTGAPPFISDIEGDEKIIYNKIKKFDFNYNNKNGILISYLPRKLISKIICPKEDRLNCTEILNHKFLEEINYKSKNPFEHKNQIIRQSSFLNNFKEFNNSFLIQKNLYKILVHRFSYSEIKNLNEIFIVLDKDNDGTISIKEFFKGMKAVFPNYSSKEIKELFDLIDINHSKKINYSEFILASVNKKIFQEGEKIFEIFDIADNSHDNKISYNEFYRLLGKDIDIKKFKEEYLKFDENKDGFISKDEFKKILTKKKESILQTEKTKELQVIEKGCCNQCLFI
jgi:calcium-dependent protein kinase